MVRCAALSLDTHREEGALGAGSCMHLPSWDEMEPRKLQASPSACQAAKSDVTTGPRTLAHSRTCREEPQGCIASKANGASRAPRRSVGLRDGWGGKVHLPILLRIEFHTILTPLAPLLLLASLSNCRFCFGSQDWWSMPALHTGWSLSLPGCSACPWCPALLLTKTQCDVSPWSWGGSPGPGK